MLTNNYFSVSVVCKLGGNMNKIIDLHELKSKCYIVLTADLNELLFAYWNLLKSESNEDLGNYLSLIYEIIRALNLGDEIKNVSFEDDTSYVGGYYNFEEKRLTLNIQKLLQVRNLNILSNENFVIEYLTILFHEIFHAIQYRYLINYDDYLISVMKQLSINIKQNRDLNTQLHDLIPDEREASIESAKLIYDFAQQNKLLNTVERNETANNLNFYLSNGYFYRSGISIFPYQSISRFDKTVPSLVDKEVDTYNKLIYGLDIHKNPTLSLLESESKKRLLKL